MVTQTITTGACGSPARLLACIGLMGALGEDMGKWRLHISSNRRVLAMSLMQTETGQVTNLTATVPAD